MSPEEQRRDNCSGLHVNCGEIAPGHDAFSISVVISGPLAFSAADGGNEVAHILDQSAESPNRIGILEVALNVRSTFGDGESAHAPGGTFKPVCQHEAVTAPCLGYPVPNRERLLHEKGRDRKSTRLNSS